jgi:hypothetical protein
MPPSSQDGGKSILYLYNGIQSTILGENQPMPSKTSDMDVDHFLLCFHCLPLVSVKTFLKLLAQGFWSHVQASKCD